MPYYGDGAPYGFYTGGAFANHSSLMTGINRYHNPIAARYSPHLSTISESPFVTLRRFSPAVTGATSTHTAALSRPRRIIDTADIDVSKPPRSLAQDNRQQRHRLRRDRPTIKIRSQALKDNPALREYNERHEKTVGELLVEKFLIKDKAEEKMKLYHQPSLMSRELSKERENEILAAIKRRITRRMTRRRSSADVGPLDPEQIEMEAALHAAQAEAFDSLVAEEQAEIEVEVRRGTFAKRQAMRLPLEVSETEEDDELEEEERKADGSRKHSTTKKRKRRKSADRLSVKSDDDEDDDLEIPESVIEEDEFEWDEREKCDDLASVLPLDSETVLPTKEDLPVPQEPRKAEEKLEQPEESAPKDEPARAKAKDKKPREKSRLKRTISAPQPRMDEPSAGFKIEACNSVGDFSTLYVKSAAQSQTSPGFRSIEQFRESIRLPAPRQRSHGGNIETEVVLPVRKPYVRDTSRNSVYLALKPSQAKRSVDGYSSIVIDLPPTAEESANCAADRSKLDSAVAQEEREKKPDNGLAVDGAAVASDSGAAAVVVAVVVDDKPPTEQPPIARKNSAGRGAEEFVSWWDETEEEEPKKPEPRQSAVKVGDELPEKPSELRAAKAKPKLKVETSARADVEERAIRSPVDRVASPGGKKSASPLRSPIRKEASAQEKKPTTPVKKEFGQIPEKKPPSPAKEVPAVPEKKLTSPVKEVAPVLEKKLTSPVKEVAPVVEKKLTSPVKEVAAVPEKKLTSPVKEVAPVLEKKLTSPAKEVVAVPEKKLTSPVKEVTPVVEKKLTSPVKEVPLAAPVEDSIKEASAATVLPTEDNKASTLIKEEPLPVPSVVEKKPSSPVIKDSIKEAPSVPEKKLKETSAAEKKAKEPASPTEKKPVSSIKDTPKDVPPKIFEKKSLVNNDVIKPKLELPRDHHLPRIPEEPKSASPEKQAKFFPSKPAEPPVKKDKAKKKVDSEAIMKIEKKILQDSESPDKIVTGAMPEPTTPASPLTKKEPKVGLAAKKKSDASAAQPEIDFWSSIQTDESGEKAAPSNVQSPVDELQLQSKKPSAEDLKLDLSKIDDTGPAADDLKTPLVEDQDRTPLVDEPSTPLVENLSAVPVANLQLENRLPNGELPVSSSASAEEAKKSEQTEDTGQSAPEPELTGTVKKISKWANQDNLNQADRDATPLASQEVTPQASLASTKKKVVKRKKSSATQKKKPSEKSAEGGTKTKKAPVKKVAPSPQTSQLKNAMSASGSPRNTPGQRPADLLKLFYTTPAILLTATPRDLQKVRRAKAKKKKPATRTPSLSSDSTGSTRSTATTTSTEEGSNCEEDEERKRLASTRSNDSGFDGSPRLSNCDMVCHKKCEKLTGNLCGLNQKLVAEALQALKNKAPSQSSENQRNADGDQYHHSGRITPPATNLPRFKKYEVTDFNFLKVLGKGSFGKVLLAELRGTECVYAVKCLKKDVVLEDDDVECTLIERKVLTLATRHPYLCHLFCTFQTESHLFFVMEYLNGGDLMFHIQKSGRFSEQRAKFYAAEIWSGLIFLHKKGIVYRDLKLDNVLLDFEGHIRIADFGMCKLQIFLDRTADTFCGTPDYMAPEIIKGLKYNQAVDWWSFGVLLYEMLTGQSPFSGCDEDELFWSICNERPFIPRYLSQSATDILVCLLEKDAGKRIPGHEIACHPFFCTIAWDKLERRSLEAPFKPAVEHTLDTRYFDTAFTTERPRLTPVPEQILTSMDQAVFRGFSYTNPNATD